MHSEPIEIALAFRDTKGEYIQHVGAMLASVLHNVSRKTRFHVLHDDTLAAQGQYMLKSMVQGRAQEILFHAIDPRTCLASVDESSPIMQPLTLATLYRLFIPTISAMHDVQRLIYLDTDIIVDCDIAALWDVDLGSALLGAVPDPCLCGALMRKGGTPRDTWARDVARYTLRQGVPMTHYFNAGVLLLDLQRVRDEELFAKATEFLLQNPLLLHPDQDALNKVFFGRTCTLPKKFNYLLHTDIVDDVYEGVWHYSGPKKPWLHDMPKADRYHHYLALTPFAPFVPAVYP